MDKTNSVPFGGVAVQETSWPSGVLVFLLYPTLSHPKPFHRPLRSPFSTMKRNRAELTPSKAPKTPAKTQRCFKDPISKGTERARVTPPEKPRKGGGAEKRSAAATAVDSSGAAALAQVQEEVQERPLGWDEFGGWWWWGAEEEMLLGWFPFVEEDFLCYENRGGSGLFWEEEDHDIWQLQHIKEIPNQAK